MYRIIVAVEIWFNDIDKIEWRFHPKCLVSDDLEELKAFCDSQYNEETGEEWKEVLQEMKDYLAPMIACDICDITSYSYIVDEDYNNVCNKEWSTCPVWS